MLALPAQAGAQSAEEFAKQTQNPIANLISVPFQGNWDFGIGDNNNTSTLLNFQPVVPFAITSSTNVVLRVIMPLTSQPGGADGARINGLGDILMTAFFSPSKAGRIIWGVGPAILLPTATDNALGSEKFGIGPSVVVLAQPGKWTVGILFNQLWSTSGAKDRTDVNQIYLQPFANYNVGSGLAVGVSMEAAGELERGRHVDGAAAVQRQQGHAARYAAGELIGGRRPDGRRSGCRRELEVPPCGHVPVPALRGTSHPST